MVERPIIGTRKLSELTMWEIAQAIAVASDQATYFRHKADATDDEDVSNQAYADQCFGVRNDCIAEIRDREQRKETR